MATATWSTETYPGASVQYEEPTMLYDDTSNFEDAGTPRYDQVGESTSWSLEAQ